MPDQCRHGPCEELPTLHAEVVTKNTRPRVQWEGNFCAVHGLGSVTYWLNNLGRKDTLTVTPWRKKDHSG